MLVREFVDSFLKKGNKEDEFMGAKHVYVYKWPNPNLVDCFTRNKRENVITDCVAYESHIRKVVFCADKWDPSFRVRGYGKHIRNSGIRYIELFI